MRKGSQKGFNHYKIFGDITVIYIENRKNEIFEVLIDTEDLGKLINLNYSWFIAWGINRKDYYVLTNIWKNGKKTTIKLQKIIANAEDNEIVDHIDNNTLNHKKENLRIVESNQNSLNRSGKNSNNKTGKRNICFINGFFRLQLQINKKNYLFPEKFTDIEEAGDFAKEMRKKYYGEFSGLD